MRENCTSGSVGRAEEAVSRTATSPDPTAMISVDNTTRCSEGPLARCASNPVKAQAEEPRRSLGPVVNVVAWRNTVG